MNPPAGVEIFLGFLSALLGVAYLLSRVRKEDMRILRETNEDLRKSINDKGTELAEMRVKVLDLTTRLTALETSNKTLEDLVRSALEAYFKSNPDRALAMQKGIQ